MCRSGVVLSVTPCMDSTGLPEHTVMAGMTYACISVPNACNGNNFDQL